MDTDKSVQEKSASSALKPLRKEIILNGIASVRDLEAAIAADGTSWASAGRAPNSNSSKCPSRSLGSRRHCQAAFNSANGAWRRPFPLRRPVRAVGVNLRRRARNFCLSNSASSQGRRGSCEQGEIIRHANHRQALKLSPQEQLLAALGFFTLNPPSCSASTKSSSLPVT